MEKAAFRYLTCHKLRSVLTPASHEANCNVMQCNLAMTINTIVIGYIVQWSLKYFMPITISDSWWSGNEARGYLVSFNDRQFQSIEV